MEIACARCRTPLDCNPGADCWCTGLAFLPMPRGSETCLCRRCLEAEIARAGAPTVTRQKKRPRPAGGAAKVEDRPTGPSRDRA